MCGCNASSAALVCGRNASSPPHRCGCNFSHVMSLCSRPVLDCCLPRNSVSVSEAPSVLPGPAYVSEPWVAAVNPRSYTSACRFLCVSLGTLCRARSWSPCFNTTNCKHFYSFSSSVSPTRHRAWSPCSRMFLCLGSPSGLPSLLIFPHPVSRQGVVALLAHVPRRDALPAPASGQRFQALQIRRPVPGRRRGNAAAELVRRLTRGGMNAAGKRGRNECCETRRMAHFQRRRA